MKWIKLLLISIVAFSLVIFCFSLLFPNSVVLSRVTNIAGTSSALKQRLQSNEISFRQWLLPPEAPGLDIRTSDISFYRNNLFNAEPQQNADTLYFEIRQNGSSVIQGGIGLYQLEPDSVTTQLFYVFQTRWYRPWQKMALMLADKKYSPQMETALQKLKTLAHSQN